MMKRSFAVLACAGIAGLVFCGCTRDAPRTITLRMAHPLDVSHPIHQAAEFMQRRLAEESGGRVRLEIRPNSQLGSSRECIEQVQMGILDLTVSSAATLEGFIPEMGVFSVPYLFRNEEHYWRVLEGDVGQRILEAGKSVYLRGLCFYDAGSRSFYTRDRIIRTPADLDGMKIRVMQSRVCMQGVRALGATPTPISWGELYTALQQGVVDGAENNPPSFYTSRHYEVCPYYSLDRHFRIPDLLLMSPARWRRLDAEDRDLIERVAQESSRFQRKLWAEHTKQSLEALREEGVEIVRPDRGPFMERGRAVQEQYRGTRLGALIDDIRSY
ncbi:TRAP transporter substrate-binding protein [Kiritimatiella glycovorans]|uniref:TRAP dicarboxylate transporter, DctP subunit n=1 Tax=Kiritimatiella glycovorans TaxID=1307763 RepID=A0A0G3ECA3_9BACT|nr:TRAP transporter substrate-binding protein [Kiritimatiella glycovorans]AKJ64141.1 TRAP dicarboxylate transporter, DctP subunit [Kiritimatiella glycovorans]